MWYILCIHCVNFIWSYFAPLYHLKIGPRIINMLHAKHIMTDRKLSIEIRDMFDFHIFRWLNFISQTGFSYIHNQFEKYSRCYVCILSWLMMENYVNNHTNMWLKASWRKCLYMYMKVFNFFILLRVWPWLNVYIDINRIEWCLSIC